MTSKFTPLIRKKTDESNFEKLPIPKGSGPIPIDAEEAETILSQMDKDDEKDEVIRELRAEIRALKQEAETHKEIVGEISQNIQEGRDRLLETLSDTAKKAIATITHEVTREHIKERVAEEIESIKRKYDFSYRLECNDHSRDTLGIESLIVNNDLPDNTLLFVSEEKSLILEF